MDRRALLFLIVGTFSFSISGGTCDGNDERPSHFFYFRNGTLAPFYAIYTYSPTILGVTAGVAADPSIDYVEYIIGATLNLANKSRTRGAFPSLVIGTTPQSSYAEVWCVPWVDTPRISFSAFTGAYLPLEDAGVRSVFIDAATLTYKVLPKLWLGGTYILFESEVSEVQQFLGPAFRIPIRGGFLTLDILRELSASNTKIRITAELGF